MRNKENGFTLIELMIFVAIISIAIFTVLGIGVGIRGNFYWTTSGVEMQLKDEHPQVERLVLSQSERNVFAKSKIVVWEKITSGSAAKERLTVYCLDSNILFDYKIMPCDDKNAEGP